MLPIDSTSTSARSGVSRELHDTHAFNTSVPDSPIAEKNPLWISTRRPVRLSENTFNRSLKIGIQRLYKPIFIQRKVLGSRRINVRSRRCQYWSFYPVSMTARPILCICNAELFSISVPRKHNYFDHTTVGSY